MISLSQLNAKNFLVTTAIKYYKVLHIEKPKPKKKIRTQSPIQVPNRKRRLSFCLKENNQTQKNKFPLMPLHLHQKPNNSRIVNKKMIIEECRNIMNTYKMNRDIHRNTNQPILEEFNKEKEQEKEYKILQDKRQEFNREYIKKLA